MREIKFRTLCLLIIIFSVIIFLGFIGTRTSGERHDHLEQVIQERKEQHEQMSDYDKCLEKTMFVKKRHKADALQACTLLGDKDES